MLQQLQVGNVFDQRKTSANGEAADRGIGHERHSCRCNQKDPVDGLGRFFHYGSAKAGVVILIVREVLEHDGIDWIADCCGQRAGGQCCGHRARGDQLIAVQRTQRGKEQDHRRQNQGAPKQLASVQPECDSRLRRHPKCQAVPSLFATITQRMRERPQQKDSQAPNGPMLYIERQVRRIDRQRIELDTLIAEFDAQLTWPGDRIRDAHRPWRDPSDKSAARCS